jgi:protein-tyrosine phosphatase
VIDLRTPRELELRGRFPFETHPVAFHHLSFLDVVWDPAEAPTDPGSVPAFLTERYLEILDSAAPHVAHAFAALAVPGGLPAVFHCAAGKDRTGVLAALVLSSLGVSEEVVVDDYALTGEAMERMRRWAAERDPDLAEAYRSMPAAHLAAEPRAMADLLTRLRAEFGSVREYVRSLGVGNAVLFDLEDALLEP